jgi:hypothetical protein
MEKNKGQGKDKCERKDKTEGKDKVESYEKEDKGKRLSVKLKNLCAAVSAILDNKP